MTIGGIQTYITNLVNTLLEVGYKVDIYQLATKDFDTNIDGINIYGCRRTRSRMVNDLLRRVKRNLKPDDLIIFATDALCKKVPVKSIAIQHGISWDISHNVSNYFGAFIIKGLKAWRQINRANKADVLICVDYNYVNWLRASVPYLKNKNHVITNFTKMPAKVLRDNQNVVRIIFARRFFGYRGTRVFAKSVSDLLKIRNNIIVTFAGEGEDEQFLKNMFKDENHVQIIKYSSNDTFKIHQSHDIAVVPTTGSEGTSLSLLEAMASGCAVICTDVGGMTNIVINGHNGIMVDANNSEQLTFALLRLIDNKELRESFGEKARETIDDSFSYERWQQEWLKVIDNTIHNKY